MRGLIRYFRENKKRVLTVITVLAIIIFIVHFSNALIIENSKKTGNLNNISINDEHINPSKPIMDGGKISIETAQENGQVIKQFVDYCNQKDYESAYNILSDSCKKEIFNNNINLFIQNYCKKIFKEKEVNYNLKLWATDSKGYTYEITYNDDNLLTTGGVASGKNVGDYITLVSENDSIKLNINNFICYEEINKTIVENGVEITVNNRRIYKTYEKYSFTIKNNNTNTISISKMQNEEDICIVDKNNNQYTSMVYEVSNQLLNIKPGYKNNIDLSFSKVYNVYRETEKVIFNNIVMDKQDGEEKIVAEIKI